MPKDYKFDSVTGDLVRDGKGGFVLIDTAETALQEQVLHHYNKWWGAPQQGSRVHDIRAFGKDKTQAAKEEVRRALHELEKAGRISNLDVIADQPKQGRVNVASTSRDTGTGQLVKTKTGV
jgi:phage gp46-like protein